MSEGAESDCVRMRGLTLQKSDHIDSFEARHALPLELLRGFKNCSSWREGETELHVPLVGGIPRFFRSN